MTQKKNTEEKKNSASENLVNEQPVVKKASRAKRKTEDIAPAKIEAESIKEKLPMEDAATRTEKTRDDRSAIFLGAGLLIFGVLLLIGRLLSIPFGDYLWPFIFIVPGVLLFITSLNSQSGSAEGLSILGGILTSLGLLFLAQSITGLWATWAYAWALVAPTSIGVSQMIFGRHQDRESIYQSGLRVTMVGLWILLAGFIFFELIIGVSGFGLSNLGLPVMPMVLIFLGVVILIRSVLRQQR